MRRGYIWACFLFLSSVPSPALMAQGAVREFSQPNAYAVVIGISQYREEVIPKVPYAVKDAQAVAVLLETQGGIPKTHIRLLTDAKATSADLRTIGEWLRMRVKPDSTVYIYYAGHGTPNPKTGEAYLVPWDGHPDFPSQLYPLKELEDALNKLPAKQVLVLLDSCFSGAAGRSVLAKGARPMGISMENPLLAGGKVMVLAAATGSQISSDYDKAEHGLFTHYLLTGLQGEADADKDKIVTLRELVPYVRDRVGHTAVEELNREQTPVLNPSEDALGTRIALPLVRAVSLRETPKEMAKAESGPSAALTKAEQELKALEEQERQVEEQSKLAAIHQQIEEKKRQIEEKKKRMEVAKAPAYEAPTQVGKEITGKDGAPMVLVPAGEFLYGDDKRRESLDAFYMDKYEVTTRLYATFLQEAAGRAQPSDWSQQVALVGSGDRPVVGVAWRDADAYCRYYGKRLPTEREWEKAARGTDGRTYPWGNEEPTSQHALFNTRWNGYAMLAVVGSHEAGASPYGVQDLAGNVWEWTSSDYDGSNKVLRGGSFHRDASSLRSSFRHGYAVYQSYDLGFRCAMDAPK